MQGEDSLQNRQALRRDIPVIMIMYRGMQFER